MTWCWFAHLRTPEVDPDGSEAWVSVVLLPRDRLA
jgi:hypothetical protein